MINKGILKFPNKNEATEMNEDPFPYASFDLRALMESKRAGKLSPGKVWVPKYCMVHVDMLKKKWATICIDTPS